MSQWTEEEVNLLLRKYPEYAERGKPIYTLTDLFPDRSANAIEHKIRDLRGQGIVDSYSDYYDAPEEVVNTNQLKVETKEDGSMTVEAPRSNRIRTLEDLLRAADVDESLWRVDRHIINKWEVGAKNDDGQIEVEPLIQVKAWLVPDESMLAARAVERELVYDRISETAPVVPSLFTERPDQQGCMVELGLFDLHLGKYAWEGETGSGYDLDKAEQVYKEAIVSLMQNTLAYTLSEKIDYILFPIGNDFVHIDNHRAETTHKTALGPQTDGTWQEIVTRAQNLLVWAVDNLRQFAPVKVVVIPGNHDRENSWHLGALLEAWFRNVKDVDVDNGASPRKYHLYGSTLIGFTHGMYEKLNVLPITLATETPELWGRSKYREIHIGHVHHRKSLSFQVDSDSEGVMVRVLPSLSGRDSWHHRRAFVHSSCGAQAFVYDRDKGIQAIFQHTRD